MINLNIKYYKIKRIEIEFIEIELRTVSYEV